MGLKFVIKTHFKNLYIYVFVVKTAALWEKFS